MVYVTGVGKATPTHYFLSLTKTTTLAPSGYKIYTIMKARFKSSTDVKDQIARIQTYTHNTGVSPRRFFKAVGRVSSAVRCRINADPLHPDAKVQTNAYLLR